MAYTAKPIIEDFNLYSNELDAASGPAPMWAASDPLGWSLVAGRFDGDQALRPIFQQVVLLDQTLGENATSLIIELAFKQTASLIGAALGIGLELCDDADPPNPLCTMLYRTDGAVVLRDGDWTGANLAVLPGVFTQSTWWPQQIRIVIGALGSIEIWNQGQIGAAISPDHSALAIDTRGPALASAASRLRVVCGVNADPPGQRLDHIRCWNETDAGLAGGPYQLVGDTRPEVHYPANDVTVQFARTAPYEHINDPGHVAVGNPVQTTITLLANNVVYLDYTPERNHDIAQIGLYFPAAVVGNIKLALFDSDGVAGAPGTVLGQGSLSNPSAGLILATIAAAPDVTEGHHYYLGVDQDSSITYYAPLGAFGGRHASVTPYASFPVANPAVSLSLTGVSFKMVTADNYPALSELHEDGNSTWVSSSTIGDTDQYSLSPSENAPLAVDTVVARLYCWQTNAGVRDGQIEWNSNGTIVDSAAVALTSTPGYLSDVRAVDPDTGLAWDVAAPDALVIGPKVAG